MDNRRGKRVSEIERVHRERAIAFLAEHRPNATVELRDGREFTVVHLPSVYGSRNTTKEA